MNTTAYTTWTQLFNDTFENGYDADPNNDLELNDEQREQMLEECRDHLIDEANKILAPYHAYMIGNGEILGDADYAGDFPTDPTEEYDDLTSALSMVDFDSILAKYF